MEAKPLDQSPREQQTPEPDPVSAEVAETTAYVHIEGKGLDPELERRFEHE